MDTVDAAAIFSAPAAAVGAVAATPTAATPTAAVAAAFPALLPVKWAAPTSDGCVPGNGLPMDAAAALAAF
jgi:hypothetical protein